MPSARCYSGRYVCDTTDKLEATEVQWSFQLCGPAPLECYLAPRRVSSVIGQHVGPICCLAIFSTMTYAGYWHFRGCFYKFKRKKDTKKSLLFFINILFTCKTLMCVYSDTNILMAFFLPIYKEFKIFMFSRINPLFISGWRREIP